MYLTKHPDPAGAKWALDGRVLPAGFSLGELLRKTRADAITYLRNLPPGGAAGHALLPPVEADHEVWAAGGHPHYVFPTSYDELLRITAGEAAEIGA